MCSALHHSAPSAWVGAAQVDLKDKWRNLERQHQVGPSDCGPQDPQAANAQQPPQPLGLVDPATAAAAEHLAATAAMQQMAVRPASGWECIFCMLVDSAVLWKSMSCSQGACSKSVAVATAAENTVATAARRRRRCSVHVLSAPVS